ncbi:restriction endonuclease subunit S [Xenorhabdus bovienii]|uniref:restriction endonuclease subunit S n=1 Tax=Xenorhabdus bovienii TaxID=40576 RepID=UPI0023B2B013|nr:restriction endonuclease subunit S [Xenorhabdus bovienii]
MNQVAEANPKYLANSETNSVLVGYKQSELGEIPEDWECVTLGNIGQTVIGLTYSPNNVADYGILVLRSSNVQNGKLAYSDNVYVNMELPERVIVKENDILVCVRNGSRQLIGKCALIDKKAEGSAFGAFMSVFRTNSSKFIFYQFQSDLIQKQINEIMGATINQITNRDMSGFRIAIPKDEEEQTTIANALSDADTLIVKIEKLLAKKQAIKTATMQQLLTGKTRLPQFVLREDGSVKGYKDSELGEMPEDWEIKCIGQFTDCTAGGTPSTKISAYWGGTNPWMSSGELHLKQIYEVAECITDYGLTNSSTKYIPKNSVLIGLAGQGKTRGTVAINRIELCTNQSIAAIFPNENHSTEYLYYNLDGRYEELRGLSTGDGGRGGLNLTIIRKLQLAFPSKEEQSVIASILSDMDEEINILQQRLNKTRQIKQGMMQELLTGKTRLIKTTQLQPET